jgi:hypothetical protein
MSTSVRFHDAADHRNFEHTPLIEPTKQFRLLSFETSSSALSCRLQNFDLKDCPEYYALSYVYGDPSIRESIVVNGREADVNQQGWHTLKQASARASARSYYWLDAICINQDDHHEKAIQVYKIAQIFTGAIEVWACFGAEQDDSGFLFQALQSFPLDSISHAQSEAMTVTESSNELQRRTVNWLVSLGDDFDRFASALKAFGHRPFFSRMWIYQELYLAAKVVMVCGTATADMLALRDIARICTNLSHSYRPDKGYDYKGAQMRLIDMVEKTDLFSEKLNHDQHRLAMLVQRVHRNRDVLNYMEANMLFSIQEAVQELQCYDPRDKIFALLGVLDPEYGIAPDYTMSCYELSSQVLARHSCKGSTSKSQWPLKFAAILCRNLCLDFSAVEAKLAMAVNVSRRYDSRLPREFPNDKVLWYATAFGCQVSRTSSGQLTAPIAISEHEPSIESDAPLVEDRVSELCALDARTQLVVKNRVVAITASELRPGDWIVPLTDYVTELGNDTYCYGMILRTQEPGLYRIAGEIAFHPYCRPCSSSPTEPRLCRCTLEPQLHSDTRTCFDIVFNSDEVLLFSTRLRAPFETMRKASRYHARAPPLLPSGPPMKWHSSFAVEYLESSMGVLETSFTTR